MKAADGAGSASGSGDDCALHGCSAGATLFSCMSTNPSQSTCSILLHCLLPLMLVQHDIIKWGTELSLLAFLRMRQAGLVEVLS